MRASETAQQAKLAKTGHIPEFDPRTTRHNEKTDSRRLSSVVLHKHMCEGGHTHTHTHTDTWTHTLIYTTYSYHTHHTHITHT